MGELIERLRPLSLKDFVGHENVVGKDTILGKMLEKKEISSMIFWGPNGCGKTSLAHIIAASTKSSDSFISLSASTCGINDIKSALKAATAKSSKPIIIFMDEIHRFNKLQQDIFLPHVEAGTFTLIGATTENPSFSLNSALISRCRVFKLSKLTTEDVKKIIRRALAVISNKIHLVGDEFVERTDLEPGYCPEYLLDGDALDYLAEMADGDARIALNTVELIVKLLEGEEEEEEIKLTVENVKMNIERAYLLSVKECEQNKDLVSAMHKSIRAGELNAALYWLARLMASREDPVFIGKRLIRIANEDVDISDSHALDTAVHTMNACQMIGMPECDVMLGQCVIYLCKAKKIDFVQRLLNPDQYSDDC